MQKKNGNLVIEVIPKWKEDMIRVLKYGLSYARPPVPDDFKDAVNEWIDKEEKELS